jgi:chromosome segregation ATPase
MRKDHFTDEALANAKALANVKSQDAESFAEAYDFARCQRSDGSFYPIPDGKKCRKGTEASPIDPGAKRLRQGQKPVIEAAKKRLKAVNARMGKIEENLVNPRKNPAVASKKLDKLEAKATQLERVKSGKEDASLRLRKELNKINTQIGRLEEKLSSPNSKNPGATQEKIDQLERKAGKIQSVLKGGLAKKPKPEAAKKPKTDFRRDVEVGAKLRRERDAAIEKLQGRQMRLRKAYAKANQDAAVAIRAKDSARAEKAKARVEKLGEALDSANDMMRKYTGNRGNTGGRTPNKLEKGG